MTPERFREVFDFLRDRVGVNSLGLAAALQLDERFVRRLYAGKATVPEDVADWLERLMRFLAENPPPVPPGRTPDADTARPRGSSPE